MDSIAGISYYLSKMLDAIIASFTTILSFSKIAHRCILHSALSKCASAKLSTFFLVSYGP